MLGGVYRVRGGGGAGYWPANFGILIGRSL